MKHLATWLLLTAAAVFFSASVTPALAFDSQEANSIYEIPLPWVRPETAPQADLQGLADDYVARVQQSLGGSWRVATWNPQTATAGYLLGSGVNVAASLLDAPDATRAAEALVAAHPELFGVELANLRALEPVHGLGKWSAHFQQTCAGLDVYGGGLRFTFADTGRLFALGSTVYSSVDVNPTPTLSSAQALEMATAGLPFVPGRDTIEPDAALLILPVATGRTDTDFHLVWQVRVRTEEPLGIWVSYVDAHDGAVVWRYNDISFLNFVGDAFGPIQPATYCNGSEEQALRYMRVQIATVGETNTLIDGSWTIPYAGSDAKTCTATLYGPYISVTNYNGAEAQWSQTATPGVPHHISFDDTNARRDERDCFDAINDIHDFIGAFDPTYPYINARINCYVNRSDGYCPGNAWWDGTINFCAAGGSYANTGEIQGVVHHEFGHGITNQILGSQGSEGIGEGNSDILANLITQESIIGRGFYSGNCTSGIRNSDNTMWYPEDLNGSIHHDGQIIAGFQWDFMEMMQAEYGVELGTRMAAERWHFGRRLERPTTQVNQVIATFVADDDDGNLENGTPHWAMLWAAAENHGFHRYLPELRAITFTHAPLTSTDHDVDPVVVATIVDNLEVPLVADSIQVCFRLNCAPGDPFQRVCMLPTGNPNEFQAALGHLQVPTEVEYYLCARDENDSTGTAPQGAPANVYAFDVANVLDPLETETGWARNLESSDDATSGLWERLDPVGTEAQPEDDHTADGTMCYVTGNAQPGDPGGTNDVDGGATSLYSPVYDLATAEQAKLKFFRWYSNNQGNNPNSDTWVVQVRNNGGAWQDVESNQTDQNMWAYREIDLTALFGDALGSVQVKFIASDTGSGSLVEACVDDLVLIMAGDPSDAPAEISRESCYAFYGSRANPVRGATELVFQVPVASQVSLTVHDVSGRVVRTLANERFTAGVHALSWNGRDDAGRSLASGVYYCKMTTNGFEATRKLVVGR